MMQVIKVHEELPGTVPMSDEEYDYLRAYGVDDSYGSIPSPNFSHYVNFLDAGVAYAAALKEHGDYYRVPTLNMDSGTGGWWSDAVTANSVVGYNTVLANAEILFNDWI